MERCKESTIRKFSCKKKRRIKTLTIISKYLIKRLIYPLLSCDNTKNGRFTGFTPVTLKEGQPTTRNGIEEIT